MRLILLRHGIAEDRGSSGDAERGLTGEGRKKTADVCKALAGMDLRVDHILSSPLKRSTQTALLLRDALGLSRAVQETPALLPEARPEALTPILKALKSQCVALVGHEPMLSQYAIWCMGGGKVELRKAGALVLEGASLPAAGGGVLVGHFAPRHLRPLVG